MLRTKLKISLFLSAFFMSAAFVHAEVFNDISEEHPNKVAITYLKENNIVEGYEDGSFRPNNSINRAEALKIIVEAFEVNVDEKAKDRFSDVKEDQWFFKYVNSAVEEKIVQGYQDKTFKPAQEVLNSEALKMMMVAAKTAVRPSSEDVFLDVLKNEWFAPYFAAAKEKNIIWGDELGLTQPNKPLSRAEFSELIYRFLVMKEENINKFAREQFWKIYDSTYFPIAMNLDQDRWQIFESEQELVFWKPDRINKQTIWQTVYPNSALLRVFSENNPENLSSNEYFENLETAFSNKQTRRFSLAELPVLEVRENLEITWYIFLENSEVLVLIAKQGDGILAYQLSEMLRLMFDSLSVENDFVPPQENPETLKSLVFQHVLVENKGGEILRLIDDKIIIETDSIGVGTGPIDYYYSQKIDMTLKYERSADVILATQTGQTSEF
jgi:hypothetical protein